MNGVDLTRRFATVAFDGAEVPLNAVVGEVGRADGDVDRQLRVAVSLELAQMIGAMDKALEMTIEWAFDRYSFGRPLASYQELKHRFADMKLWLEASHAVADAAVRAVGDDAANAWDLLSAGKAYVGHYGVRARTGLRAASRRDRSDLRSRSPSVPAPRGARVRPVRDGSRAPGPPHRPT